MRFNDIDNGKQFDFGKTAKDYAKYRDIYPDSLYKNLYEHGIAHKGNKVLDLGTGTGVIPRAMQHYGAHFIGADISNEQIEMARTLSKESGFDIEYIVSPAEDTALPSNTFDSVIACQCFLYFDKEKVLPEIVRLLKKNGLFVTIWMTWLPFEDSLAKKSEDLVLKYNPTWTGAGYKRNDTLVPDWSKDLFDLKDMIIYKEYIPFTHDTWLGRMRSCRGVSASLDPETVKTFDQEHEKLLKESVPYEFSVLHEIEINIFKAK